MMKKFAAAIASGLLLAAAAPSAVADSLNYNFWQLGYVAVDIDNLPNKLDGWGVGGSVEVTDKIFISAGYTDVGTTIEGFDLDEQDLSLSVGYAWPLAANTDLIGRVGYVRAEAELESLGNDSDDGYSVGAGLRTRPLDAIELEAGVQYIDLSDYGDSTSFGLGCVLVLRPAGGTGRVRHVQRRRDDVPDRRARHLGPERVARQVSA